MHTDEVLAMIQEVSAELVLPRWRALAEGEVMEKQPGDLVTVADREAEVAITARLRAAYKDAIIVGEEETAADSLLPQALSTAEHAFTVDPVDGTRNFVHGSPDFGVMVAELHRGEPVRSWIWQPVHERAYVAEQGGGAWCGDRRLTTTPAAGDPQDWRLVTSAWHLRGISYAALPELVGSWISCAVDYPQLIAGAADCLLYQSSMPWDHAPGALLLAESGGALLTLDGRPYQAGPPQGWLLGVADPAIAPRLLSAFAGVSPTNAG